MEWALTRGAESVAGQPCLGHVCSREGDLIALIEESSRLPPCSRCRGNPLISAVMPQNDDQGWPIHLELCPSCDSGDAIRPAAGILVQFFADGGGHDESRS
ncbi:DUF6300 family protein [Streptomyces sp. NPDC054775]